MGYFGKSLTASDTYMDFEYHLLTFLGWKENDSEDYDPDDYKEHTERVGKEAFEGRVEEIVQWMISNEYTIEEGLFLAYHLLIRGVDVTDERIDKFIEFFMEDSWGQQDEERRIYMNLAIKALENYKTDKTPVDIDYYYDFERYYIKRAMDEKTSSIEEIRDFFEKEGGIKIKSMLRNEYDLYFVVTKKVYENLKTDKIMGIKFLTYTK